VFEEAGVLNRVVGCVVYMPKSHATGATA
jgi:hypothetical protein